MAKIYSQCPSNNCTAANPRQYSAEPEKLAAAGVTGDWITSAMRCGYCDEYYSIGTRGEKRSRGYFEGGLMIPGKWRSISG